MDERTMEQLAATAEKLAIAAEALDRVLGRLDAQQESLNAKVDRIVAAVEDNQSELPVEITASRELQEKITTLEKANHDLRAQAARMARKTLSPMVTALLAKNSREDDRVDAGILDKTLQPLSVEQRIAVKAEMARAGLIE